jgi:ribulose-5-phosphate 4-epimerase/fuculose-1-phosphate aldolase
MARARTRILTANKELVADLVSANRILFNRKIVDGYGHVSVRHDRDPEKYLMSRMCAPGLVMPADIDTYDLNNNSLFELGRPYNERFIHGEIYKVRPDVNAIVHCHAPPLIPFSVTDVPLRALYQVGSFLGDGVPVFEIRNAAGMTDLMIKTPALGKALSATLGSHSVVLMRGHGATIVGETLKIAVFRSIYATENAELQLQAMRLGNVTYLSPEEAALSTELCNRGTDRPWAIWESQVFPQVRTRKPGGAAKTQGAHG